MNTMIYRSKAPLRLGFAGGGTDVDPYCSHYGGNVLNATIDMFAYCTIEADWAGRFGIYATDIDKSFECQADSLLDIDGLLSLHKGVYNRIVRDFNDGKPLSCKITTYSDAPAGSGLGSSSTMVVAMIAAFREWLNLPLGEYDIASLAFEIERKDLGLKGGRQDQYASTFGGFNFMEFHKDEHVLINPLRIKQSICNELENSMLLYYTGVSRESSKIITEQIRNAETSNALAVGAMHEVKRGAVVLKERLLKEDIKGFAEHLGNAWNQKKRMASSISNPMIDEIMDSAIKNGAISGKITGAGGGGYIMFMVDPSKRMAIAKALSLHSGRVMNFHFESEGVQSWTASKLH